MRGSFQTAVSPPFDIRGASVYGYDPRCTRTNFDGRGYSVEETSSRTRGRYTDTARSIDDSRNWQKSTSHIPTRTIEVE